MLNLIRVLLQLPLHGRKSRITPRVLKLRKRRKASIKWPSV
ncbi:hypothetical protein DNTS_027245 [Danionella cerebrum]|uniref:Uncharacterized protein n=1 Tax=Danionella cerebrum TaxID=2873325 RepID=A0A553QV09_9TELE|nr:hypothetical protein DNTS_027245 [Danionella translucida]